MNKKRLYILLLALSLSLMLSGCAGPEERAWQSGQKALAEEKYGDAVAAFEKAGSFQDADRLLRYARAVQDLENGDLSNARAGFDALGDFKDSRLMSIYCSAREQEVLVQTGFAAGDALSASRASQEAYSLYSSLALFRDSDARAALCRDQLYTQSKEWLNNGSFEQAAAGFAALGDWQDCAALRKYCEASELEKQGSYVEAADLFSEIPGTLDAEIRSETARGRAYQLASELREHGDYEAACRAFEELGSYRDAAEQRDSAAVFLIRNLLQSGSYAEALSKLNSISDLSVFPAADSTAQGTLNAFLDSFVNVWMNAHARVMTSFFSCNLLQPYLEPGGELDTLVRAELTDTEAPLNYGFVYLGSEVTELLKLDDHFIAAKVIGSASCSGPEGMTDMKEPLQVLIDTSRDYPLAAAASPAPADSNG